MIGKIVNPGANSRAKTSRLTCMEFHRVRCVPTTSFPPGVWQTNVPSTDVDSSFLLASSDSPVSPLPRTQSLMLATPVESLSLMVLRARSNESIQRKVQLADVLERRGDERKVGGIGGDEVRIQRIYTDAINGLPHLPPLSSTVACRHYFLLRHAPSGYDAVEAREGTVIHSGEAKGPAVCRRSGVDGHCAYALC
jgi:hypothetical protein